MRLVGLAPLHQRRGGERRRRLERPVGGDRREAPERLGQLAVLRHVLQVADQEGAAARARPLAAPECQHGLPRERPQVVGRAQHRAPERMLAERRAVDQVLGQHRRLVLRAGDLLDHHAALAVELLGVDLRAPHEVRQQVDRLRDDLGPAGDVERHEIVRGVRVQDGAHRLGGLVDLAVVVVLLAALEHEMLEEMGHAVLLGALRAGSGVERDEHRCRAGRQLDAVQGQPVRQGGGLDARHGRQRTSRCIPACVQGTLRDPRIDPRSLHAHLWPPLNAICAAAGSATTRTARVRGTPPRPGRWSASPTSASATSPVTSRSTA